MRPSRFGGRLLLACDEPIKGALSTEVVLYQEAGVPGRWAATSAWWQGDILDGEDKPGSNLLNWQANAQPDDEDMVKLADGVADLYDAKTRQPKLGQRAKAKLLRDTVRAAIAKSSEVTGEFPGGAGPGALAIRVQFVVTGVPPEVAKHLASDGAEVVLFSDGGGGLISAEHDMEAPGAPPRAFYHLPRKYNLADMKAAGLDAKARITTILPAKKRA